jgi:sugar phosphate permease
MTTPSHAADSAPTHVRYQVVSLATLMAVLLYLDRFCLNLIEGFIREDLGLDKTEAGILFASFFLAYALGQVPAGWLSDRFGARAMLAIYILGWSLFTGLMGVAQTFLLLLFFRFAGGLFQAGAYPTSAGLISKWMPLSARGVASGIVATGGRIGGVLAPVLTAYLFVAFAPIYSTGWGPALVVYGLAGVIVAAWFFWKVRDRPENHPGCNAAELALIAKDRPSANPGRAGGLPLRAILENRSLWLSAVSQFFTNFGWIFLTTFTGRYLDEVHRVPVVERGWMSGLPLLVGIAGMLGGGWLTDRLTLALGLRWGRRLPMALTRFVAMAAYLSCLMLESPWAVTAAFCIVAVATDLGTPAIWAFKQDIGGRYVGSALGWGNMWGNFGAVVGPIALTAIIAPDDRWDLGFIACAAAFALSGIAALGVDSLSPLRVPEDSQSTVTQ